MVRADSLSSRARYRENWMRKYSPAENTTVGPTANSPLSPLILANCTGFDLNDARSVSLSRNFYIANGVIIIIGKPADVPTWIVKQTFQRRWDASESIITRMLMSGGSTLRGSATHDFLLHRPRDLYLSGDITLLLAPLVWRSVANTRTNRY